MKFDIVKKPEHYNWHPSGIECIEVIRNLPFALGNVIKYCFRSNHKNGIQDLKKTKRYIEFMTGDTFHIAVSAVADDIDWCRKITLLQHTPDPNNPILDKAVELLDSIRNKSYSDYRICAIDLYVMIDNYIKSHDGDDLNPILLN